MITFQQQSIAFAERVDQMRRGLPGISQHTELVTAVAGNVLYWFPCIMRNSVGDQFKVADGQAFAVAAKMQINTLTCLLHRLIGAEAEPHGQPMAASKFEYTADMILVFMRDDNPGEIGRLHVQLLQTALGFPDGKPAIQHDCRAG